MAEPEPPYQLLFEERKGYLYARVSATAITPAAAIKYLSEISGKCTEIGCEQLMLVRDIPEVLDDADLDFVTFGFQHMIGSKKVAIVNPHKAIREDMKFAIVMGLNRGGEYNIFDREDEAERWLLD